MVSVLKNQQERFDACIQRWIEHCQQPSVLCSSNASTVTDCDAYREILSMGTAALPLIRKSYDRETSFYIHAEDKNGELAAFSSKSVTQRPDFFQAMMAFQYAESEEESSQGFTAMLKVAQEETEKDLPLSMIKGHGLLALVHEIIGSDFKIPVELRGKISEMERYTKGWLDENGDKYA